MGRDLKVGVKKKIWLEYDGMPIMGQGRYEILKSIDATQSIKKTAKQLHIAEKTIQNYIDKIEGRIRKKITVSSRGGRIGGGHTQLTQTGKHLLELFERHDELERL